MHIQDHFAQYIKLPNDYELGIIVRMSRGRADEVEAKWQEMVELEKKAGWEV